MVKMNSSGTEVNQLLITLMQWMTPSYYWRGNLVIQKFIFTIYKYRCCWIFKSLSHLELQSKSFTPQSLGTGGNISWGLFINLETRGIWSCASEMPFLVQYWSRDTDDIGSMKEWFKFRWLVESILRKPIVSDF